MPDIIKAKKLSDFCSWVHYDNPEFGVQADIIGIKFSETERRRIAANVSPQSVGGEYERELKGNDWQSFVFTKSLGMLPMETWKEVAARGYTEASGTKVMPSNVSAPTLLGQSYIYDMQICPKCNASFINQNAKFCPSCGTQLPTYVPKSNTENKKSGVP